MADLGDVDADVLPTPSPSKKNKKDKPVQDKPAPSTGKKTGANPKHVGKKVN